MQVDLPARGNPTPNLSKTGWNQLLVDGPKFGDSFHVAVAELLTSVSYMTTAILDAPGASDSRPATGDNVLNFPAIRSIRVADDFEWSLVGEPLHDRELRERVTSVLCEVTTFPGFDKGAALADGRDFSSIQAALKSVYDNLAEYIGGAEFTATAPAGSRLVALLSEVGHLQLEVARARASQQVDRYAAVRNALSRLHGVDSVEQMLERAPAELCRCGFDRVIVSRVEESMWMVENVHVKGDPEWAGEIARVGRAHPMPIDHTLIESEIMRRRAPVLVRDAQNDPHTNAAIGHASLSRSYVAAPIMPDGRIIGFVHADCYVSRRHVDEEDLAVLWMFAEGFGYAFQRTALSERLRSARNEIQRRRPVHRPVRARRTHAAGRRWQHPSTAGRGDAGREHRYRVGAVTP